MRSFNDDGDINPYSVLGVSPRASPSEIRIAYRAKARTLHPDVCKEADAPERFRQLVRAFKMLTDSKQRAAVDSANAKRAAAERAARAWNDVEESVRERPAGSRRQYEQESPEASERRRKRWREMLFEEVFRDHLPLEASLSAAQRAAFIATLETAVQSFVARADSAGGSELALSEEEEALLRLENREVLLDELADVRHRKRLHRERLVRLRDELERTDRRAEIWRKATPGTQGERIEAMRRELDYLDLASRLRERLSDQRLALERIELLIVALEARLDQLPART